MRYRDVCVLLVTAGCMFAAPSLHIPEAEAKKAAIEKPAPAYPMVARQLKLKGKVELEATVSEAGSVDDVKVVSGNPVLAKPAQDAVKKWRFKPFLADGQPAPAIVSLSFEFDTH